MDRKPFRLMHAKVALLGFRSNTDDVERWQLRLIVSTGNWTRATLEDSLDLAWRIDISSADIKSTVHLTLSPKMLIARPIRSS